MQERASVPLVVGYWSDRRRMRGAGGRLPFVWEEGRGPAAACRSRSALVLVSGPRGLRRNGLCRAQRHNDGAPGARRRPLRARTAARATSARDRSPGRKHARARRGRAADRGRPVGTVRRRRSSRAATRPADVGARQSPKLRLGSPSLTRFASTSRPLRDRTCWHCSSPRSSGCSPTPRCRRSSSLRARRARAGDGGRCYRPRGLRARHRSVHRCFRPHPIRPARPCALSRRRSHGLRAARRFTDDRPRAGCARVDRGRRRLRHRLHDGLPRSRLDHPAQRPAVYTALFFSVRRSHPAASLPPGGLSTDRELPRGLRARRNRSGRCCLSLSHASWRPGR